MNKLDSVEDHSSLQEGVQHGPYVQKDFEELPAVDQLEQHKQAAANAYQGGRINKTSSDELNLNAAEAINGAYVEEGKKQDDLNEGPFEHNGTKEDAEDPRNYPGNVDK